MRFTTRTFRRLAFALLVAGIVVALPAAAFAHLERSSYWPNPAADKSVKPAAGGKVPRTRSLFTALKKKPPGVTRVVCKPDSLRRARRSISKARKKGYRFRPTERLRKLSRRKTRSLRRMNKRLFKKCKYRHIQKAVFRSRNNDRIVVMPGRYLEQPSRRKPSNDPKCANLREESDKGAGALSYRYQVKCPNDQNLIYIGGRKVPSKPPPIPARKSRFGIPDEGPCVRCNLQLQGSGVVPGDVLLDAAKDPKAPLRKQVDSVKDVVLRADRADGVVIRNMTAAHAGEHGFYVHETDGYLLDNVKMFYNKEYGTLTFTSDHGMTSDCEGVGQGDSAVYPGAAVETGEQRRERGGRKNQAITRCDLHHNTLGYSGTMANATHVYENNFWDNSTGLVTDSFFAGGHPGYPQDSSLIERNNFWANNFNSFAKGSDVEPKIPAPVGTGILIAGGNGNFVQNNRIWDNWRRGVMLMAVPDVAAGETGTHSTSSRNQFRMNTMGRDRSGRGSPNGVDFWWDQYPGNTDNCWYDNGKVTSDPPGGLLPADCDNVSSGVLYPTRAAELGGCAAVLLAPGERSYDPGKCPWFRSPPRPGGAGARQRSPLLGDGARFAGLVRDLCGVVGDSTLSCAPFRGRP